MSCRRALAVSTIVTTLTSAGLPVAAASPTQSACSFTLAPPSVEVLPGDVTAVVATVAPHACTGNAAPISTEVCISAPNHPGVCSGGVTWSPAKAILPGTNPHGAFTATGRGCWDEPTTMVNPCTQLGPTTATI